MPLLNWLLCQLPPKILNMIYESLCLTFIHSCSFISSLLKCVLFFSNQRNLELLFHMLLFLFRYLPKSWPLPGMVITTFDFGNAKQSLRLRCSIILSLIHSIVSPMIPRAAVDLQYRNDKVCCWCLFLEASPLDSLGVIGLFMYQSSHSLHCSI